MRLGKGRTFEIAIDAFEYVAVVLSGRCNIRTNRGDFENVGRRDNVFCGMPHALYLPPHTEFEIEAITDDFEFASCWAPTEKEHPPRLITPNDVELLLLGGGNCSRQMNRLIGTDFLADRLLVYELYTPGGNWSSYPPHKHDTHRTDAKGNVLEAQLSRFSFYKFDRPTGYACQRVYSADKRSDAMMLARQHDIILMPEGYYTLVSAPGTTTYTLNFPGRLHARLRPQRRPGLRLGAAYADEHGPAPASGGPGHGCRLLARLSRQVACIGARNGGHKRARMRQLSSACFPDSC